VHDGQKFLIDTELDDDIDDALALFAAMQNRFNLLGVTIVFSTILEKRCNAM